MGQEISSKKFRKDLKRVSKDEQMTYGHAMYLISSAMAAMDYDRAETICRKAISRFPSFPGTYYEMARILLHQNELKDAMRFLEVSMEKTCRLLLIAEKKVKDKDDRFLSHSLQRRYFLDRMNMIFTKLQENLQSIKNGNSSIFIADWIVNDKKFISLWWFDFEIIKEETKQTNKSIPIYPPLLYYDGEWVIAHGLTSSVGKTLNHRVATIKGDDLNDEGRVAVVFEKGGPIKNLKVENLKRASTVNKKAALLMSFDESEQWEFMR